MTTKTDEQELLPCPFCGAGTTEVRENGRPWLGTKGWGEPVSVSVRHWCEPVDGQPSRLLERVGRDRAAAIDAWNRRAAPQPAEPMKPHLCVSYDDKYDVLYVDCNDSDEPFDADEDDKGILYRRAISDGRLIGITVMNFIGTP